MIINNTDQFSSSFSTFWGFNLGAGGDGGYILDSRAFILGGGRWWWVILECDEWWWAFFG